ncbi:MAG: lactonase family protein, partial [Planctomycetaceae bacterium]|nr:lactonase family protein [Planctomycetaceae bacterium]
MRQFVYISVGGEKRIAIYASDLETGRLTEAGSLQLEGAPGSLAVNADGTRMYAAVRSAKAVATLKIDPATGQLEQLGQTPVVDNPVYVLTDPSGRFLLTTYYGAGKAAVYRIGADGIVEPEAVQIVECEKNPHSIQADATGRFVYVPNTGSDSILQYAFDRETGRLEALKPAKVATAEGTGPRHVRFHPGAPYVYFVNEKGSSVDVFRHDGETGQLEAVQTIPTLPEGFEGKNYCADIEFSPDGKFLYASNRGHDSLAGYRVDAGTGKLTSLGQFPTEAFPREFAITPDGRFV